MRGFGCGSLTPTDSVGCFGHISFFPVFCLDGLDLGPWGEGIPVIAICVGQTSVTAILRVECS